MTKRVSDSNLDAVNAAEFHRMRTVAMPIVSEVQTVKTSKNSAYRTSKTIINRDHKISHLTSIKNNINLSNENIVVASIKQFNGSN